jgi:hypothetical protein
LNLNFAECIAYAHSKLDFAVSQKKKAHGKMVLCGTPQTLFFAVIFLVAVAK